MNIPDTALARLSGAATQSTAVAMRSGSPENPANDLDGASWESIFGGEPTTSGVKVTQAKALSYSPFWRGINLIAYTVAKLPLVVYSNDASDVRSKFKTHAAYPLLKRKPNDEMHAFTFKQTLTAHAITRGNGYGWILRDPVGYEPLEVIPLNPDQTYPVRVDGQLWYVTNVRGVARKMLPENVLHIKGLGFDGLSGYDVVKIARHSLGLGLAAEKFGAKFFANAARPSVAIKHPKNLTPDAAAKLRASWERINAGLDNAFRALVLEEGMEVQPFSFNAKESQLTELREHQVREVANWLGLPPHKLGDSSRTAYASLEQENQAFLDECIDPWLCAWEQECNAKLLTEEEQSTETAFVEFTRGALVRADMEKRYAAYATALGGRPFMKQNEVRRMENLEPIDGGDVVLEPLNMGKVTPTGEPKPPTKEGKTKRYRSSRSKRPKLRHADALRRVLVDALGRMTRRLGVQTRKAVKDWKTFSASLDALDKDNRTVVVEAIGAPIELAYADRPERRHGAVLIVADKLFAGFKRDMLEASGRANPETLAEVIEAAIVAAESRWPAELAAAVIKGEV